MDQLPESVVEKVNEQDFTEPSIREKSDPLIPFLNKVFARPQSSPTPEQNKFMKIVLAIMFVLIFPPLWVVFHYIFHDNAGIFFKCMGVSFFSTFSDLAARVTVVFCFVAGIRLISRVPIGTVVFRALTLMTLITLAFKLVSSCLPDQASFVKIAQSF